MVAALAAASNLNMPNPYNVSCPSCRAEFAVPPNIIKKIETAFEKTYGRKLREQAESTGRLATGLLRLQAKARSVSGEVAGTVLENDLEAQLRDHFKTDKIERLQRGRNGADVYQHVLTTEGECVGVIVWEAKQTSKWSSQWVKKLEADVRKTNDTRSIGVIVSEALPAGIINLGIHRKIWVCSFDCVVGLAIAIRNGLITAERERKLAFVDEGPRQAVFDYLTSKEFAERISTSVSALAQMKGDLDKERVETERKWKRREQQIHLAAEGVAGVFSDLSAVIPGKLPLLDNANETDLLLLPPRTRRMK